MINLLPTIILVVHCSLVLGLVACVIGTTIMVTRLQRKLAQVQEDVKELLKKSE